MEPTGQGNDFELIPTVKMETRYPVKGSLGSEFPSIYNQCGVTDASSRKTLKFFNNVCSFFGKTTPYGTIFKIPFRKFSLGHRSTCCVQISWNLADGKWVKSCIAY